MPRGRKTALTADERQTLTAWQRSTTLPAGRVRRARIIVLIADEVPIVQVARLAGISRRFVYKWAQRFVQDGLEGLTDKQGRGRRPGRGRSTTGPEGLR